MKYRHLVPFLLMSIGLTACSSNEPKFNNSRFFINEREREYVAQPYYVPMNTVAGSGWFDDVSNSRIKSSSYSLPRNFTSMSSSMNRSSITAKGSSSISSFGGRSS